MTRNLAKHLQPTLSTEQSWNEWYFTLLKKLSQTDRFIVCVYKMKCLKNYYYKAPGNIKQRKAYVRRWTREYFCHKWINYQNCQWSINWLSPENSPHFKQAVIDITLAALFKFLSVSLVHRYQAEPDYGPFKNRFTQHL